MVKTKRRSQHGPFLGESAALESPGVADNQSPGLEPSLR